MRYYPALTSSAPVAAVTVTGTATIATLDVGSGGASMTGPLATSGALGLFGTTPTTQPTAVTHLTDNTAGTADSTLAAMADVAVDVVDAAKRADVNARLVVIRNNFADLSAIVNTILTKLESLGIIDT